MKPQESKHKDKNKGEKRRVGGGGSKGNKKPNRKRGKAIKK
jgi:hypothetical protein